MEFTFSFHQTDDKLWIASVEEIPDLVVGAPTMEEAEKRIQVALNRAITVIRSKLSEDAKVWEWDIFISHASEDKQDIVRPIVERLKALGLRVWYDEFEIKLGQSWVQKIEEGLTKSKYGLFIISSNFAQKDWTRREYDTFQALVRGSDGRILPVRHNVSQAEVNALFPLLSSIQNTSTDDGFDKVVQEIMGVVEPQNLYYTDGTRGIVVKPANLKIYSESWSIVGNNTAYIQNTTNEPVYAVMLRITLESQDLSFSDININGLGNAIIVTADDVWLCPISVIPPLSSREISVTTIKASNDIHSRLCFEIDTFQSEPSPMLGQ
jgi:predicted RNase H-like HicB family nuclease